MNFEYMDYDKYYMPTSDWKLTCTDHLVAHVAGMAERYEAWQEVDRDIF